MRLTPTNRKDYKTEKTTDKNGFPYLIWKQYPAQSELSNLKNVEGSRVWLAGSSISEKWFIVAKHEPNSPGFPDGGYTVKSSTGEVCDIWFNEAVLHPSSSKASRVGK